MCIVYRLCNDDVIIVPDMLHRDIQLYCPSLRAYHCGIWYLVTIFVDDLSHYIKNRKKSNKISDDDVINILTSLKIHNQLCSTFAMACRSKTWYCLSFLI